MTKDGTSGGKRAQVKAKYLAFPYLDAPLSIKWVKFATVLSNLSNKLYFPFVSAVAKQLTVGLECALLRRWGLQLSSLGLALADG